MKTPTINLDKYVIGLSRSGAVSQLQPRLFSLTTTGQPDAGYPTDVHLRYDPPKGALVIDVECNNDPYVAQNNYTKNNSDMWNQEVFEMFISPDLETPTRYVEIELNPNDALFSAWITNPNGQGNHNTIDLFDSAEAGIETSVRQQSASFNGHIVFPLSILGTQQDSYRLNFFRVVSRIPHDPHTAWACSADSCTYLAWSPTYSGAKPAFHIPAYFGRLDLQPT